MPFSNLCNVHQSEVQIKREQRNGEYFEFQVRSMVERHIYFNFLTPKNRQEQS